MLANYSSLSKCDGFAYSLKPHERGRYMFVLDVCIVELQCAHMASCAACLHCCSLSRQVLQVS